MSLGIHRCSLSALYVPNPRWEGVPFIMEVRKTSLRNAAVFPYILIFACVYFVSRLVSRRYVCWEEEIEVLQGVIRQGDSKGRRPTQSLAGGSSREGVLQTRKGLASLCRVLLVSFFLSGFPFSLSCLVCM